MLLDGGPDHLGGTAWWAQDHNAAKRTLYFNGTTVGSGPERNTVISKSSFEVRAVTDVPGFGCAVQ